MREKPIKWSWLGRVPYLKAIAKMEAMAEEVACGGEGCILFLEHPPTITLGRRADDKALKASRKRLAELGVSVERADRGGEATYHGPGQLIAYPVVCLKELGCGIETYVQRLLDAVLKTVTELGVTGARADDVERPGIWTERGKIAAIGLRVKRGIASHGVAINLDVDKSHFGLIIPCGMEGASVANVSDFVQPPGLPEAARIMATKMEMVFNMPVCESGKKGQGLQATGYMPLSAGSLEERHDDH